jgi:hypothetical protein
MSAGSYYPIPRLLAAHLPLFYGYVILFAVGCAGFARAGGGVAILAIFVAPMTSHFGWSRTATSGAASLGACSPPWRYPGLAACLTAQAHAPCSA